MEYTKYSDVTNVAGVVASNAIDTAFIKGKNFYDKSEVDTIVENKVEQKRGIYIYDNVDTPTQVMDSNGYLYQFGIEFVGGYFVVTSATEQVMFGKYTYMGLLNGTNVWKNAQQM